MLNKFDFNKYWKIRDGLTAGRVGFECRYKEHGWQWLKDEMDKIDESLELLEELNDFLVERSMVKYDAPDNYTNDFEPHFKKVA